MTLLPGALDPKKCEPTGSTARVPFNGQHNGHIEGALRHSCNFCPNTCTQEAKLITVLHLGVVTLLRCTKVSPGSEALGRRWIETDPPALSVRAGADGIAGGVTTLSSSIKP
jgi:hypothetical protein